MRVWTAIALGLAAALTGAAAAASERVSVHLIWRHQAQFAGYYVAEAKGLFAARGLQVDLVPGGPGIDPLRRLAAGEVDVAVGWLAHAIEMRRAGADLVNVAQIFQHPGTMLVCRRKPGFHDRPQLAGKTIGVWRLGDDVDLGHWLLREGIAPASVRMVPQRADGIDLIEGRTDCVTAMSYNEYWKILDAGMPPAALFFVNFAGLLEDGLYVRRALLESAADRARVARLLAALAEGWSLAARWPEEALGIVLARIPGLDPAHQRRMLESTLELVDQDRPFGFLDPAAFAAALDILAGGASDPAGTRAAAEDAWSRVIWREAGLDRPR